MNKIYVLLSILVMALVTYLPRVLPIALLRTKIKNIYLRSFLTYIPYGVLSAMIFPAIFYSTGNISSALFGTIVALFLSYKRKGLLPVALSAVAAVLASEFLF